MTHAADSDHDVPSVLAIQGESPGSPVIPRLTFGTWTVHGRECVDAVAAALSAGYRHIDTAQAYQNESEVGRGIELSGVDRSEIFITTKIDRANVFPDGIRRSTEASAQALRVDEIDLLLLHWPPDMVPLEVPLSAMADEVTRGLVHHVGVSNFPSAELHRAVQVAPIACNQVEYHPYLRQDTLLAAASEDNTAVFAYAALARGRVLNDPVVQEVAEAHGKTAAQVVVRWLLQHKELGAVVGSSNPSHIQANAEVWDFSLSPSEMNLITSLADGDRIVDPWFAPDWDSN